MDKQVLKVHAIYLNLTSQCLCQQFYHSGRKTGAFACKNRKKKIWLLAQEWDLFSSQSYWSIISKCTPQPENLRHLATCIFWLRRCIKKGLLWLMHENWIDTPRPCWWAANLNDYAISSYKAITHPLYPDQKERENFWVLILHVKTQTLEKNPWTCTRITHINSLRTHLRPEAVIWRSNVPFHLEISGCNHDVRNGRQSDRRSRTHLQADIKQRHVCVCTDRWTLMMKTCWVCFTCSLPRSILSIRLSPLWRSSSRFISSWAILSYKVKQLHLYEECVLPSLLSVNLHTKLCEIKICL